MPQSPDIAGYKDAQDRLRQNLGQDIEFHVPVPKVYGPDVALDPETGEPYDPTEVPESGGGHTTVTVKATVVFHPIRREQDLVSSEPVGLMNDEHVVLIVAVADEPDVRPANEFVLNGKEYGVTDIVPDGLVDIDRYLVYGEAR